MVERRVARGGWKPILDLTFCFYLLRKILFLSGKCQGIQKSDVCGIHVHGIERVFVCRAPEEPVKTTAPTQVSSVCETYIEPSAIALYDYESAAIEDLSFNVSDALHDF